MSGPEVTSAGGPTNFDPNNFTKDELLRLVYRDIQHLILNTESRQRDYAEEKRMQDEMIKHNELDIRELKTIISEQNKAFKNSLTIISISLGLLSILSGALGWIINH